MVAIDANAPALSRARDRAKANMTLVHHLPLRAFVRLQHLLRPRGVLVVIGLYQMSSISDFACAHAGLLVSTWHRMTRASAPVAAPIQDPKETLPEIRTAAAKNLLGAEVSRLLLFRYSLVWHKS